MTDDIAAIRQSDRGYTKIILLSFLILSLVLLISSFAVTDCDTSGANSDEDITFEDNNVKYLVSKTESNAVTVIYKDSGYSGAVNIPSTVSYSLTTYNVTAIDASAFSYCMNLTSISVSSSVTTIGERAFYKCIGLTTVSLPSTLKNIGNYAFFGCTGLETFSLPNELETIGVYSFGYCSDLISMDIPRYVESIDSTAFVGCDSLLSFSVSSNNGYYSAVDGVLFDKDATRLLHYPAGLISTLYTVPNKVIAVEDYAFAGCINLTAVILTNDVKTIGVEAFGGCEGLRSMTVTDSVVTIDENAFEGCSNISYFKMGSGVKTISYGTFADCIGLTSFTLPSNIISIADRAFYGCFHLVEICNDSNIVLTPGSYDNGYIATYAENIYSSESGQTILVSEESEDFDITYIDKGSIIEVITLTAYTGTITLPVFEKTAVIRATAFMDNNDIVNITIPDCYTQIGGSAFYQCPNLASVTIGNGVNTIGAACFYECTALNDISIGRAVTTIGNYAFYGCSNLTSVIFDSENCTTVGTTVFDGCGIYASGMTVTFTDNVKSIPEKLFYDDTEHNITNVHISDSVTKIGEYAFFDCKKIEHIYISENLESIGKYTFFSCIFFDQDGETRLDQTCKNLSGFDFTGEASMRLVREDSFTITFYDDSGTLNDTLVRPVYSEIKSIAYTIKKASTEQYDFVQTGWMYVSTNTEVLYPFTLTEDISLKPIYSGTIRWYTVTFYDYDKTVIKTETKQYGSALEQPPTPERESTNQQTYTFSGWVNSSGNAIHIPNMVSSDLEAYASYTAAPRMDGTVNVFFVLGAAIAVIIITAILLWIKKPE